MEKDLFVLTPEEASQLDGFIEDLDQKELKREPESLTKTVKASTERIKSPQNMRYSAEVELIQKKWGDLETIRGKLGLSQRKMAQLLMVDPSAWTRWTRYEQSAPPHIYRALSWFLLLQEEETHLGSPYTWLQSVARPSLPKQEIASIGEKLKEHVLLEAQKQMSKAQYRLRWLFIVNLALLLTLATLILLKSI